MQQQFEKMRDAITEMSRETVTKFRNEISIGDGNERVENVLSLTKLEKIQEEDENKVVMDIVREKLEQELKKVSAKSLCDLEPQKNKRVAFKITLNNPEEKPIKCRVRPLPENLSDPSGDRTHHL